MKLYANAERVLLRFVRWPYSMSFPTNDNRWRWGTGLDTLRR